jgi:hypothetical protein
MGEAGEEDLRIGGDWRSWFSDLLTRLGDLLLNTEPLWVIPALAFTCTSLLWGLNYSWAGLVVASIPLVLRRWRKGYFSHRTPFELPGALFLVASLVGLSFSPDRGLSLRAFQSCLACILLYYSLVNIPHSAYIKWGFAFAGVCVFVAMLLAFGNGFTPPPIAASFGTWVQEQLRHLPQVPRLSKIVTPTMSTVHGLTIAVEIVLLPLVGLILFSRKVSSKIVAVLLSLPLLMMLLLFGSQGAWLAVLVAVVVLLVWRSRWAVLPVTVVLGLGYMGYRQGWIDPHSLVNEFHPSYSLKVRIELWKGAIDVIQHHPITGCGLGCLGESATTYLSPHNAYLQFYADMGLVGALALLCALIIGGKMAVDLMKASRSHPWYGFAVGLLAAAVAVGVHGLFEGSPACILAQSKDAYYYIVSPILAILAGLFVRTQRIVASTP